MAWSVELSRTATRQITKLDRVPQERIVRFLRERIATGENPRQWGKALRGEKRELWAYRVGDYRIICDVQDERSTVLVLWVAHRKEAYR